jgi:hypothetical protein
LLKKLTVANALSDKSKQTRACTGQIQFLSKQY